MIVNKKSIYTLNIFTDIIFLIGSFLFSAIAAQSIEILFSKSYMFALLGIEIILWVPVTSSFNTYNEYLNRAPITTFLNVFKISIFQTAVAIFFIFVFRENLFTRYFIIYFFISLFFSLSIKQILFRKILKLFRKKGFNIRKVAIIDLSLNNKNLKNFFESNPQFGLEVAYEYKNFDSEEINSELIENNLLLNNIELVVISSSPEMSSNINAILRLTDKLGIQSYLVPNFNALIPSKFELSFLGELPVISFRRNLLDEFQSKLVKRVFDLLFTVIAFVTILWWLLPLISIIIRLTSKGSALFIQKRVGYKGKLFKCYKFRTMTIEASNNNNKAIAVEKHDSRITKIGAILRRTNLDELPQLLNVLIGDMSLVGPRPHAISFEKLYSEMIEEIKLRNRVKPGLTGWAQINGLRGDVKDPDENKLRAKKRIEFDIWYIENWSIWFDLRIIFQTIVQTLFGKNFGV